MSFEKLSLPSGVGGEDNPSSLCQYFRPDFRPWLSNAKIIVCDYSSGTNLFQAVVPTFSLPCKRFTGQKTRKYKQKYGLCAISPVTSHGGHRRWDDDGDISIGASFFFKLALGHRPHTLTTFLYDINANKYDVIKCRLINIKYSQTVNNLLWDTVAICDCVGGSFSVRCASVKVDS